MRRVAFTVLAIGVGCVLGFFIASRTLSVRGAAKPGEGAVAIPGQVGGQDIFGAYEVVKGWPKDDDPIFRNSPYIDSFTIMLMYEGKLQPV